MTDCLFHFHEAALEVHHLTDGDFIPKRYGTHHQLIFPAGTFQGPQGWIVVLALDLQWKNFCTALGRPDLEDDPRYAKMADRAERREELVKVVEEWMATFDTDEAVLAALEDAHVPAAPVLSPLDALDHPYFKSRDMVRWVEDPVLGSIPIPGFPFKFGAQSQLPDIRAPFLGEHNAEVLKEELGLSDDRIAALANSGVLHSKRS